MSSYEWEDMMKNSAKMNEAEFDDLLKDCIAELPPSDIIAGVTPWKQAMNRILWGLALTTITFQFYCLDYILPAIGMFLMLLGFRTLRKENAWLKACWIIISIRAVFFFTNLILNTTIYRNELYANAFMNIVTVLSLSLTFVQVFCLWNGIREVQKKAGLQPRAGAAIGLLIWYGVICLLATIGYAGYVLSAVMIISYILIIRSLYKLSKELDEAGYMIETASVKLSDRGLVTAILVTLTIGMGSGYLFFNSYAMDWKPLEASVDTKTAEIKEHLVELGFPEQILDDLTEEDILACEDALRVVVETRHHPVNAGREVREQGVDGIYIYTVYDVEELSITGIAVELPKEKETWKIFHHFYWDVNPGFYGTEVIQLWTAYSLGEQGWKAVNDFSGQILYNIGTDVYVAPYESLGKETYTSNSFLFGEQSNTEVFATFSLPNDGEKQRGYISYSIEEVEDGWLIDAWINYTHQNTWVQFPVQTAKENRMSGSWNTDRVFKLVQDAVQFNPNRE